MKRACILLLLVPMIASIPLLGQKAPHEGQVISAFTGGSVWTSSSGGTCITYFPVLGDLNVAELFAPDATGAPQIDKEHAYFIWVSDWSISYMFQNSGFGGSVISLALVPAGKATIYYTDNPLSRVWSDVTDRSTWGVPVATFIRGGGMFQSPDGFVQTDRFYYSAQLVTSRDVNLHGRRFNFREVVPHGMTCFENGQVGSTTEVGACTAMGE